MKKITKAILLKREKKLERKQKKKLWKELCEIVKKNQNNKCYVCDLEVFNRHAHIHHIVARTVKELKYDVANLVLLCSRCHFFSPLAVHQTSIYFSDLLLEREPERYLYLLNMIKGISNKN